MHQRLLAWIVVVALATFLAVTTEANAQNPYPECPPNSTTIWVYREFYGDPAGEILAIPFERGTYPDDDPHDSEGELNNYVAGVLEMEIGGTAETPLASWQPEAARAVAVGVRTVGYNWCGVELSDGHRGVDDHSRQHYRPGWSIERASEYRNFAEETAGQHLTYDGNVFDLQYRKYVGQQTNDREPNGPHKRISDLVSSPNEASDSGMGVHSANHWAEGQHNASGCEGGSAVGCDGTPIGQWEPNLQWDYRRILAHYYTAITFQGFSPYVPSYHRWNMLDTSVKTSALPSGSNLPVAVRIQNSSIQTYVDTVDVRYYQLIYAWYYSDGITPVGLSSTAAIPGTVDRGADMTVTLSINTPSSTGVYVLRWDMRRQQYDPYLREWFWEIFSQSGWPTQDSSFDVHPFPYHIYLPAVMNDY